MCKFPSVHPGIMPQRCLNIPHIRIEQSRFTCEMGNLIDCVGVDRASNSPDILSLVGNFSVSSESIKNTSAGVAFEVPNVQSIMLNTTSIFEAEGKKIIGDMAQKAKNYLCRRIKDRALPLFCETP